MSSFNTFGFFALTSGKRIATHSPGATYPVHHCHYITSLKSSADGVYVAATLRVYSGAGDAPLADNTVAFVLAKVYAPTGQPVELDALYMAAIPGDVNSDTYDDAIPEIPTFLYGVGHVPQSHTAEVLADNSKLFIVCVSDYVGGSPKNSTIQCTYPPTKRWSNVPAPRPQSCTQFLGVCNGFGPSGLLLGPHSLSQSTASSQSNTDPSAAPATPSRRKKYTAIGSTSTPTTETKPTTHIAVEAPVRLQATAPSSLNAVAGQGPSTTSTRETRSRKRRAPTPSRSPAPEDEDTDIVEETPVKAKGKKKAK
ncbi:hypothetical protein B0H19DRAFT_1235514 [Mycena capillaripes]|nr:hypothetical protein B0H19DRAFT_1235514 [Mycena capillaripes]